ncbi:MAG TPA: hypothetical protein VF701_05125 [Thermoanaerobaculia bacterium]
MKSVLIVIAVSVTLMLGAGCNADRGATESAEVPLNDTGAPVIAATAAELTPEQLGEIAARIRKEPSRADEILAEHRLTQEIFEEAIRRVTEDVEASQRYSAAYRKASA